MNSFGKKVSHGMELLPLLFSSAEKKKIDHSFSLRMPLELGERPLGEY